jgi:hypothetical protein
MKKILVLAVGIVLIIVVVLVVILVVGGGDNGGGGNDEVAGAVKVPINFQDASNVGSISIDLTYDAAVLQVLEVKAGELAQNAMLEYNIKNPGRVIIGIVDSSGINGNGAVAKIGFNVVAPSGTTPLTLQAVDTHDATSLIDIINTTSNGSFTGQNQTLTPPVISFRP